MAYYGASYLPPTSSSAIFDSSSFNRANEALTYETALDNFLSYPTAQGTENLKKTNVSGVLTLTNDLIINGPTGPSANYIQFTDGTQQSTAFIEANYAQLNKNNIFLQPFTNTFQGNNASVGLTAPFVISNSQTTNKASLYIDDANNLDATLYSNQTDGGLTVRNAAGFSFTVAPLAPNNTATFSNPISCGSNSLTCGAITGSQLTLSSGGQTSVLTTTASGLNVADPIIANGSVTSTALQLSSGGNDGYLINSRSAQGYGLVFANTSGGNGEVTISNSNANIFSMTCTAPNVLDLGGGSITTTGALTASQLTLTSGANTSVLTTTANGLDVADNITVSAQTYPLTSSNQVATLKYVNDAISSQGGGDASLTANQTFSGINTFSSTAQTSATQTFPQLSTNQFATFAYVNNLGSSSGSNYLIISSPQLTSGFQITYTSPSGSSPSSGKATYIANTGVNGTVYSYTGNQYCGIIQSQLGSPNCIFNLSVNIGVGIGTNENLSLRVINGGTQYTLPISVSNGVLTTTTPLSMTTSQTYNFYLQGSFIN